MVVAAAAAAAASAADAAAVAGRAAAVAAAAAAAAAAVVVVAVHVEFARSHVTTYAPKGLCMVPACLMAWVSVDTDRRRSAGPGALEGAAQDQIRELHGVRGSDRPCFCSWWKALLETTSRLQQQKFQKCRIQLVLTKAP